MPLKSDRVAYYYDSDVGRCYFGPNHPMKPARLVMTHHLVMGYNLHEKMEIYRPRRAYPMELAQFHSEDYIDFLSRVTPDNQHMYMNQVDKHKIFEDCPMVDDMFEFCKIYTGASLEGALRLCHGTRCVRRQSRGMPVGLVQ